MNDVLKDYEFLYKENLDLKDKISSLENKIGEYKNLKRLFENYGYGAGIRRTLARKLPA